MRQERIKRVLFGVILLILLLPLVQYNTQLVESGKLHGATTYTARPKLSLATWWDGTYQEKENAHLNDSFGFRPDFVRMTNQIDASLFNKYHTDGIVVGPGWYMYGRHYIDHYYGRTFAGSALYREKLGKLKAIQDTLRKMGKALFFIHPPSKAWVYSDHFPKHMRQKPTTQTDYLEFKRIADSLGIDQLDLNKYIAQMRYKDTNLLVSRQSIHWTYYGCYLAADTLIRYMERLTGRNMANIRWNDAIYTDEPIASEEKAVEFLNLIWHPVKERFTYPNVFYDNDSTVKKPKAIYISDSFFWTFVYTNIPGNIHDHWEFWYYFNERYTSDEKDKRNNISQIDIFKAIEETDIVAIMFTEINLHAAGNGFIERVHDAYFKAGERPRQ